MLDLGFIKIYTRKEDRKKLRDYIEEKTLAESLFEINKNLKNKIKENDDTLLEYMNIITEYKKEIKRLKTLLTKNKISYRKEEE
jgi:hypothetical protein